MSGRVGIAQQGQLHVFRNSEPDWDTMNTTIAGSVAAVSAERLNAGLAVIRVIVGSVFLAHGAQKLFVYGLGGVTGAFAGMGIPLAGVVGPAVAFLEFLGGLALVLGLFTRIAGLGLAAVMLGAIFTVHLAGGFFAPEGVEFVLTLFAAALALALTGPGGFSLDAALEQRRA
jgi:putative oxidoreductase